MTTTPERAAARRRRPSPAGSGCAEPAPTQKTAGTTERATQDSPGALEVGFLRDDYVGAFDDQEDGAGDGAAAWLDSPAWDEHGETADRCEGTSEGTDTSAGWDDTDWADDDGAWADDDVAWADEDGAWPAWAALDVRDHGLCDLLADGTAPSPTVGTVVRDEREALLCLRDVVGPVGGQPALWIMCFDEDDRVLPAVLVVDEIPPVPPRGAAVVALAKALEEAELSSTSPSVAVAVVRHGGGVAAPLEARWAEAVRAAASDLGVPLRALAAIGARRASLLPL